MNRHYKMPGFLVSVALHGGLAAVLLWQQSLNSSTPPPAVVLPVKLEMFQITQQPVPQAELVKVEEPVKEPPKPQKKVEKVKPKKIVKKKTIAKKKKPRVAKKPPEVVKPVVPVAAPVVKPAPMPKVARAVMPATSRHGNTNEIRESYKQRLLDVITTHKFYPRRARRRHIEGSVEVGFVVMANGEIQNLRLANSSGETVLDKAALEALRRAGRFDPLPKELGLSSWDFVVPLEYRLL